MNAGSNKRSRHNSPDGEAAAGRILVPVDFSAVSADAVRRALELARANRGAVTLLHVIEAPEVSRLGSFYAADAAARMRRQSERCLARWMDKNVSGAGTAEAVDAVVRIAPSVAPVIEREAERRGCDVIVMGVRKRSRFHRYLPSVSRHVMAHARCPVLAVHSPDYAEASPGQHGRIRWPCPGKRHASAAQPW